MNDHPCAKDSSGGSSVPKAPTAVNQVVGGSSGAANPYYSGTTMDPNTYWGQQSQQYQAQNGSQTPATGLGTQQQYQQLYGNTGGASGAGYVPAGSQQPGGNSYGVNLGGGAVNNAGQAPSAAGAASGPSTQNGFLNNTGPSGYSRNDIYAMAQNPASAANTPFAQYAHNWGGGYAPTFNMQQAQHANTAMGLGLDPSQFTAQSGAGNLNVAIRDAQRAQGLIGRGSVTQPMRNSAGLESLNPAAMQPQPRAVMAQNAAMGQPQVAPGVNPGGAITPYGAPGAPPSPVQLASALTRGRRG